MFFLRTLSLLCGLATLIMVAGSRTHALSDSTICSSPFYSSISKIYLSIEPDIPFAPNWDTIVSRNLRPLKPFLDEAGIEIEYVGVNPVIFPIDDPSTVSVNIVYSFVHSADFSIPVPGDYIIATWLEIARIENNTVAARLTDPRFRRSVTDTVTESSFLGMGQLQQIFCAVIAGSTDKRCSTPQSLGANELVAQSQPCRQRDRHDAASDMYENQDAQDFLKRRGRLKWKETPHL